MDLWLYTGPGALRALTNEPAGANLPADLGPWGLVRFVRFEGSAPDEREAIALVQEHGYCCFE
jgi:hypothetical protein